MFAYAQKTLTTQEFKPKVFWGLVYVDMLLSYKSSYYSKEFNNLELRKINVALCD